MSVVLTLLELQELELNPGKYRTGRIEEHSKHLDNYNRYSYTPLQLHNSQQPGQQSRVYKCHKGILMFYALRTL